MRRNLANMTHKYHEINKGTRNECSLKTKRCKLYLFSSAIINIVAPDK